MRTDEKTRRWHSVVRLKGNRICALNRLASESRGPDATHLHLFLLVDLPTLRVKEFLWM